MDTDESLLLMMRRRSEISTQYRNLIIIASAGTEVYLRNPRQLNDIVYHFKKFNFVDSCELNRQEILN